MDRELIRTAIRIDLRIEIRIAPERIPDLAITVRDEMKVVVLSPIVALEDVTVKDPVTERALTATTDRVREALEVVTAVSIRMADSAKTAALTRIRTAPLTVVQDPDRVALPKIRRHLRALKLQRRTWKRSVRKIRDV